MRVSSLAFCLSLLALPALAQHQHGTTPAPAAPAASTGSSAEFAAANQAMHQQMAITPTGDADRDFAAMMIPHHQGAIEMARIELRHGKDPAMRRLAEAIIAAQEKEIAELRAFLARR